MNHGEGLLKEGVKPCMVINFFHGVRGRMNGGPLFSLTPLSPKKKSSLVRQAPSILKDSEYYSKAARSRQSKSVYRVLKGGMTS